MRGNDFILNDALDFLDLADVHHVSSGYEQRLPLSPIWAGEWTDRKRAILKASGSASDAVETLQAQLFMGVPPERETQLAIEWHLDTLRKQGIDPSSLPDYAQEAFFAPAEVIYRIDGRRYRPDFFRHLGTLLRLQKALGDQSPRTILELGAGTGNLARLFLGAWPKVRYVIIDLPDMLVYSFMYLRLNFPDFSYHFVTGERPLGREEAAQFQFIFCPVSYQDAVLDLPFDLFVNTASLGETRAETVRHWFDVVQKRVQPRWLLSVNRYLNTVVPYLHDWRLEENTTAMCIDADWRILDWELEPSFMACPYVNKYSRHLLVIGEREAADPIERKRISKRLAEEAALGSWNQPPLEMTHQDNVLASDLTQSGILYKIWQSIRLDESETNLQLMLSYLDTLCHKSDRHFEEYFQYRQQLDLLAGKSTAVAPNDILASRPDTMPPILVEALLGFNIVKYKSRYLCVPQALGSRDLTNEDVDSLPDVLIGRDLADARRQIRHLNGA